MKPLHTEDKPFDAPVAVAVGAIVRDVGSVGDAYALLNDVGWPERGPRHRDASETCLKVFDGHRSTADARNRFVEAAREAGILRRG